MASEDVSTALSLMRFAKEFWGVGVALTMGGALYMQAKNAKTRIDERLDSHDERLDVIDAEIRTIRENWVTEEKLEKMLEKHTENTVNKVLVAIGSERRGHPR